MSHIKKKLKKYFLLFFLVYVFDFVNKHCVTVKKFGEIFPHKILLKLIWKVLLLIRGIFRNNREIRFVHFMDLVAELLIY
jgi:hypothetical protein